MVNPFTVTRGAIRKGGGGSPTDGGRREPAREGAGGSATFEAALRRGSALAWQGRWGEAAAEYRLAVSHSPGDVAARSYLAMALYKSGQLREAAELYRALWEEQPTNGTLLRRLADVQEAIGDLPAAAASLSRLADMHAERGAAEESLQFLHRAVELCPDDLGLWDALMQTAGQLDALVPLMPRYLDLARRLALDGRFQEAVGVVERAQTLDPTNPLVMPLLAAIRAALGYKWRAATRGETPTSEDLARLIPELSSLAADSLPQLRDERGGDAAASARPSDESQSFVPAPSGEAVALSGELEVEDSSPAVAAMPTAGELATEVGGWSDPEFQLERREPPARAEAETEEGDGAGEPAMEEAEELEPAASSEEVWSGSLAAERVELGSSDTKVEEVAEAPSLPGDETPECVDPLPSEEVLAGDGVADGVAGEPEAEAEGSGIAVAEQLVELAESFVEVGQSEQALEMYGQALELCPDLPRTLLGLARIELAAGKLAAAEEKARRVVESGAGGEDTVLAAAKLVRDALVGRAMEGDLAAAAEGMQWLRSRVSREVQRAAGVGDGGSALAEFLGACGAEHLEELARLSPEVRGEVVFSLRSAESMLKSRQLRSAADEMFRLIGEQPGFLPAHSILMRALVGLGRRREAADKSSRLVQLYELRGTPMHALEVLRWRVGAGFGDADDRTRLARLLRGQNRHEEAAAVEAGQVIDLGDEALV